MQLIGISEEDLAAVIEDAVRRGYERGRKDVEAQEWLNSSEEICAFLKIAPSTFRDNRRHGKYGEAIIGRGRECKARKSELLDAIRTYNLSKL